MAATTDRPLAETLGAFAAEFDLRSSPSRDIVLQKAKMHILDGIGVALASTTMDDKYAQKLEGVVQRFQGAPVCSIIGLGGRTAPAWAALMNGALIHGCEFDDSSMERTCHTESFAVPVALALSEQRGLSGWDMIHGWLMATELAVRASWGCNEDSLNATNFHNTAVFGTIGAAAGAGRLLGLDADRVATAISLAVSFAAGTNQGWNEGSSRNKSIQPGWAAMSGIMAGQMAATGYDCSHSTLDGPRGLYASHAWRHGANTDRVLEGLGESWRCLNIIFKVYPTGGWNQALIDCTRQLVIDNDIKPDEVEHVHITVSSRFADHFEHGRYERMFRPDSGFALHGSWPCAAAMAILHRRVGFEHMTLEEAKNPAMLAIADRITCEPGPIRGEPEERPITVVITTNRGTFSGARTRSTGYPSEVTTERIAEKFQGNAALVLPEQKVRALQDLVYKLEEIPDVRALSELLSP